MYKENSILKLLLTSSLTVQASLAGFAAETPQVMLSDHERRSEEILRELVAFETTPQRPGETRRALQAVADLLLASGFEAADVQLVNPAPGVHGLVVRYRGLGQARPVLVLAHIDVVTVTPDDWAFPPFSLGVRNGFYLGRGTADNKAGVTQIVSNFIRLKAEGWMPGRDLVAEITGDEETDGHMANWFANEGRDLVNAEFALNTDSGGGQYSEAGERVAFWVQTSEKLYHTFTLTASNAGGHSSIPRPDNAIQDLALAITRLSENPFPVILSDSMKMTLQRSADMYPPAIGQAMRNLAEDPQDAAAARTLSGFNPYFNALLRTTCTPTMLSGGHAENALPRDAVLTLNCRILPGTTVAEVEARIAGLVDGLGIEIATLFESYPSGTSRMPDAFRESIESLVEELWPGVPVIPSMSTGATDALFFRNTGMPVYGVGAIFRKPGEHRAHGLDEKVGIVEFHESVAFWYRLLRMVGEP